MEIMGTPYNKMSPEQKAVFNAYCIQRWRNLKSEAVAYKGGKCEDCGYDKCEAALEFHHLDPSIKEASWNKIRLWGKERLFKELDKCVILCANCHRERHYNEAP